MHIVSLSGSPSARSRSAWLLQLAQARLEHHAARVDSIALRELPAGQLLIGDGTAEPIRNAVEAVAAADVVLVATPIYKAAYSGLLKLFFDLLPADVLRGKAVLPLATGGSPAHLLALDYALKPVLGALGARHLLDSVYATEAQLPVDGAGGYAPHPELVARLDRALQPLLVSSPALAG